MKYSRIWSPYDRGSLVPFNRGISPSDISSYRSSSSDPRTESVSGLDPSSATSGAGLREDRVAMVALVSAPLTRRAGLVAALATRCFGARGGLLTAGVNSIMGRRCSQLYSFANARPLSRGIHVPGCYIRQED